MALHKKVTKLQSAMEYLMTYGWAILIIAIVLVALFEFGIFNSANFSPKAPAGGCQVFRPQGPGTQTNLNLEGECNGELPEYAAQLGTTTSIINVSSAGFPSMSSSTSIFAWIYPTGNSQASPDGEGAVFYGVQLPGETLWELFGIVNNSGPEDLIIYPWVDGPDNGNISTLAVPINHWDFVGFTYSAGKANITLYMNGQSQVLPIPIQTSSAYATMMNIGNDYNYSEGYPPPQDPIMGSMADFQFYNFSMPANDVQSLYHEGIGGAPIDLRNLVGWWPLNGNAQDYSGNQDSGVAYNVTYTSSWSSGYTPP